MAWTDGGLMNLGLIDKVASTDIYDSDYFATAYPEGLVLGADNAPMVLRGDAMQSIGELGNIFDPIRPAAASLSIIQYLRSGGRTLSIGKPDAVWDGTRSSALGDPEMLYQTSRSRGWAAWRLCDLFTVRDDDARFGDPDRPAGTKAEVEGLYNPNGILRDKGRALRALVQGLRFGDGNDSDPALKGKEFDAQGTELPGTPGSSQPLDASAGGQALARYLGQRLTRAYPTRFSPLWEPGELSQLFLFNRAANQLDAGATTAKVNDRGQEEIFRRLAGLITTKGNTFSIYAVGQTMDKQGKPVAIQAERVIVRLHPVFDPDLIDDFDPTSAASVTARFHPPASYRLEVLSREGA